MPIGFAHCYCTLSDDAEVYFKLGCGYSPTHARGFAWDDPDLDIRWPIAKEEAIVRPRDLDRPRFRDLTELFPCPAE